MMDQRISAGGIFIHQNKVLLVRHQRENVIDFWVLPGGGIECREGFMKAAYHEVPGRKFEWNDLHRKPAEARQLSDGVVSANRKFPQGITLIDIGE